MQKPQHDHRCANASRTKHESCTCICEGKLHGVPHSNRANVLLVAVSSTTQAKEEPSEGHERRLKYAKKAGQDSKTKKYSDLAAEIAINTILHDKNKEAIQELINTLSSIITSSLIDKVTSRVLQEDNFLTQNQINCFMDIIKNSHLICLMCCKILDLIREIEQNICKKVEAAVEDYLKTSFTALDEILRTIIVKASKATTKKIIEIIKQSSQIDKVEKAIQVITLIFCPDYSKHTEVLTLCFFPLTKGSLDEIMEKHIDENLAKSGKAIQKIVQTKQSASDQYSDQSTSEIDSSSDSCDPSGSQQYPDDESKENDALVPYTESNA